MSDDDSKRDKPDDENGGNWIHAVLGDVLERVAREQAAAEAHAAQCTARPCERCQRFSCKRCGAPVDGSKVCTDCDQAEWQTRLLRATQDSVPAHFRWAMASDCKTLSERILAPAATIERALKNPPSTSLLFLGNTGAGKTSLAVAMLGAWLRKEPSKRTGALFVEASWLARARARHKLGEESPDVTAALSCPLLVLDDLGNEREDRDGCITDVIYGRSNAELPTWVTCGLAMERPTIDAFAAVLAKRYDGGFVRRIIEHGKRVMLGAAK